MAYIVLGQIQILFLTRPLLVQKLFVLFPIHSWLPVRMFPSYQPKHDNTCSPHVDRFAVGELVISLFRRLVSPGTTANKVLDVVNLSSHAKVYDLQFAEVGFRNH